MEIDLEEQLVTVSGVVNPEIIIQKLVNSGKHAELLSSQEADNKRETTRSLPHDLSLMHNGHDPAMPTLYGAHVLDDSIVTKPWMGEFGYSVMNSAAMRNMFLLWDHPDISSGDELQGTFRAYSTGTGNYQDLSSGFLGYEYPSSSLQVSSQHNYPPIERMSVMESYSPMFPVASPCTYWT